VAGANNAFASTEYNSNNVRNVNYNGNCNNANKNNTYAVAPVLEIVCPCCSKMNSHMLIS